MVRYSFQVLDTDGNDASIGMELIQFGGHHNLSDNAH